ncbi:DUF2971 domain-containing protein [Vibrio campbellii]|uniref:DUF2971 domain-containing protein n=1 Tax=Vibrio campbellii TaxID=680 RepID=A0ABY5I8A4_9VIBR|nr:DUF2971 domain-containing protein [Vibrio campbellii]UTZ22038.1 DUF2971 domain-containing protein [Vibrio campbellii]UTZ30550.1 DUF2971 domain-containing protein [Vibrio campbellii]
MSIPIKIYKYEPMSVQSLINLKAQALYFNSPSNFNDPFDCEVPLELRFPYDPEAQLIKTHYEIEFRNSKEFQKYDQLRNTTLKEFKVSLEKMATDLYEQGVKGLFKDKGVSCFSETNDNLLMWSHYASSAKGFCLEFRTDIEPFEKARKVNYVANPQQVDYVKMMLGGGDYFLDNLLCTKSSHWAYEKEWRVFHHEVNKVYYYPSDSLTAVYFGSEIDRDFLEIICLIIQGQNPNVKFYQGTRSNDQFSLIFEEVTYKPHVAAQA